MHVTKLSNSNTTMLINGRQLNISRYRATDQFSRSRADKTARTAVLRRVGLLPSAL